MSNQLSPLGDTDRELLVEDIRRHLSNMASLLRHERTGNPVFSKELRALAEALKPHRTITVRDLSLLIANAGRERFSPKTTERRSRPRKELPKDLKSLGSDEVSLILDDHEYLKTQIVDLGEMRFGIPRGKLNRMPKESAVASIRAALDHERSLIALDRQAKIAGSRRA